MKVLEHYRLNKSRKFNFSSTPTTYKRASSDVLFCSRIFCESEWEFRWDFGQIWESSERDFSLWERPLLIINVRLDRFDEVVWEIKGEIFRDISEKNVIFGNEKVKSEKNSHTFLEWGIREFYFRNTFKSIISSINKQKGFEPIKQSRIVITKLTKQICWNEQ